VGAERDFALKPVGGKMQRHPATHVGLMMLPAEYNESHEHAVPEDPGLRGVRYAINAQHRPRG